MGSVQVNMYSNLVGYISGLFSNKCCVYGDHQEYTYTVVCEKLVVEKIHEKKFRGKKFSS